MLCDIWWRCLGREVNRSSSSLIQLQQWTSRFALGRIGLAESQPVIRQSSQSWSNKRSAHQVGAFVVDVVFTILSSCLGTMFFLFFSDKLEPEPIPYQPKVQRINIPGMNSYVQITDPLRTAKRDHRHIKAPKCRLVIHQACAWGDERPKTTDPVTIPTAKANTTNTE